MGRFNRTQGEKKKKASRFGLTFLGRLDFRIGAEEGT